MDAMEDVPQHAPRRGPRAAASEGRTVYVGNLSWSTAWQDLKDHMRRVGEVLYADVMTGPGGRSKGCGIVEYATAEQAQAAIAQLNDTELAGRLIFVREDRESSGGFGGGAPHAGGDFAAGGGGDHYGGGGHFGGGGGFRGGRGGFRGGRGRGGFGGGHAGGHSGGGSGLRVYVGNLAWSVTWQRLKDHFKQAGDVAYAEVLTGPDGRSKGCGIVEFTDIAGAQAAIQMLNDSNIDGRVIFVREDREERA